MSIYLIFEQLIVHCKQVVHFLDNIRTNLD